MDMKTVNVAALKQNLSEYLHLVEGGENVLVTSHRRPVARLVPGPAVETGIRASTRPIGDLRKITPVMLQLGFSAETILLAERRR